MRAFYAVIYTEERDGDGDYRLRPIVWRFVEDTPGSDRGRGFRDAFVKRNRHRKARAVKASDRLVRRAKLGRVEMITD